MWTAAGQRVTAQPGFMPDASPEIREIYRRHARGNSLFRNRGDGTFEDVTLAAGAEFGRWAWSSDAFDFDSDGWQDLYVVNGMFTRDGRRAVRRRGQLLLAPGGGAVAAGRARPGTPYDDGWRATNRLLVSDGAQAQHERNVLLRNDGQGGFDDVSGTVGLDLDQDGRAFAVFDYDGDGDPDLVLLAPRSSPQLRLFRNDFAGGPRRARAAADRDEEQPRRHRRARDGRRPTRCAPTRVLMAGSGFVSQHSKELLFGLGRSTRIAKVTITWPSGLRPDAARRAARPPRVRRGGQGRRAQPSRSGRPARRRLLRPRRSPRPLRPRPASGCTSRSRRPTSRCATSTGRSARSRGWRAGPRWSSSGRRGRRPRSRRFGAGAPARGARGRGRLRPRRLASTRARTRPRSRGRRAAPACRSRSRAKKWRAPRTSSTATCSTAARTCSCPRCSW